MWIYGADLMYAISALGWLVLINVVYFDRRQQNGMFDVDFKHGAS